MAFLFLLKIVFEKWRRLIKIYIGIAGEFSGEILGSGNKSLFLKIFDP
jgi:hypothetical protein